MRAVLYGRSYKKYTAILKHAITKRYMDEIYQVFADRL